MVLSWSSVALLFLIEGKMSEPSVGNTVRQSEIIKTIFGLYPCSVSALII